jgi:hypothetical protein
MILFVGCSFTWGAGLQFEYLIDNEEWTIEQCNKLIPPKSFMEHLNYKSDMFRKKNHFPNLVAKHFDKHYALSNIGNGGDNKNIKFAINNLDKFIVHQEGKSNPIKLVVVQFTEWTRVTDDTMETQVDKIVKSLGNTKWIGLSWRDDISQYLKKIKPYNFCPIEYKGIHYDNFEELIDSPQCCNNELWSTDEKLTLYGKYEGKLNDDHFCKKGHKVMAKSIIKKIKENNIF